MAIMTDSRVAAQFFSCDAQLLDERLIQDSDRLFMKDVDEIEIWTTENSKENRTALPEAELVSTQTIFHDVVPKLHQLWQTLPGRDTFYVLRQNYSWDYLRLSLRTLQAILNHHHVFPFFLEIVHAFGVRIKDDFDIWNCFHARQSDKGHGSDNSEHQVEISYLVHYFQENHRGRGDPWSFRQTGFYHRFNCSTMESAYIIIQPSEYVEKRIKEMMRIASHNVELGEVRHVLPHIAVLSASAVNWKSYTKSLATGLERLEKKAVLSQADYDESNDYVLRFSDRQKLQKLQQRIRRALGVLSSASHTAKMIRPLCNDRKFIKSTGSRKLVTDEIESYQAEVVHYQSVLQDLLRRVTDTCDLLTNILQYKAGMATLSSAHATTQSLTSLIQIGRQGELDGKIAQQTSINTTSLTFVATIYLPATLLSAMFSSNLVAVQDDHFVIATDFWKFVVLLIPMIVGTFALMIFSQKFWMRSFAKQVKAGTTNPHTVV